ncbi:MAG: hypothetical protein AAB091_01575 [Elusimicrobiota bacterium]
MQIYLVVLAIVLCVGAPALAWAFFRRGGEREQTPLTGIRIMPYQRENEKEILKIAGSLARHGRSGAIGAAILKAASANDVASADVKYFQEFPNLGAGAVVDGRAVVMGSARLMAECSVELPRIMTRETAEEEAHGRRVVYLGWEGEARAMLIFEKRSKRLNRPAAAAIFILLGSLATTGCNRITPARTIKGTLTLEGSRHQHLINKPNAVCYMVIKDRWGIPVAIRRWLNPKFPLYFRITSDDRLVASRPWQGPFQAEAYFFESDNAERELPPPPGAARAIHEKAVYPSVTGNLEMVLQ